MKISIITINYNNAIGLQKTIESVINQSFKNFEYIIIDGGSNDRSISIIKNYEEKITHWISEVDKGVYDAMNKGIELASGDYLLMLNSGDCLTNENILENVFNEIHRNSCDIIYGNVIWEEQGIFRNGFFPNNLSFNYFRNHSLGHQATFIKKEVHEIVGLYDTKLKICSDWEFLILSICKYNMSYRHIDTAISICGRDGISCDPKSLKVIKQERNEILMKYFKAYLHDYLIMDKDLNELNRIKRTKFFKIYNRLINLKKKFTLNLSV